MPVGARLDEPLLEVEEELDGDEANYLLRVGKDDLGKVIGKKGRTAKALRTLLAAAGSKQGLRVSLDIAEPERDEPNPNKRGADASSSDADDAATA